MSETRPTTSTCRNCKRVIAFGVAVTREWNHVRWGGYDGSRYCLDESGRFTASPLTVAEPVLETRTL